MINGEQVMSSQINVSLVEDDTLANAEAGVIEVVKVADLIYMILKPNENNFEQQSDMSGFVVSIRRTRPGNSSFTV